MTAIRDLLPAYALGCLGDEEAELVVNAVSADPLLAAELDELLVAGGDLALLATPVTPAPGVRDRLLDSVRGERFARFNRRFAELFDVAVDRARELLGMIDQPAAWEPGPSPHSWLAHFSAGPRLATADAGFIRLERGQRFAWHRHHGDELCLILQGEAEDSVCGTLRAGDESQMVGGTEHDFAAVGDQDLIVAVWVNGVDFSVPRPG